MKKTVLAVLIIAVLFTLCSCNEKIDNENPKLIVTAVLFAEYDFARQVAGDCAEVSMLLPAGSESHSYDPTPQDIIKIKNSDVFIYGGGESDSWLDSIISSLDTEETEIISMMELCSLYQEETVEGMQEEKGNNEQNGEEEYDEHIWTSPKNAIKIIEEIQRVLSEKDEENSENYKLNAEKYIKELEELDNEFSNTVKKAKRNTVVFADRFPFLYFAKEYSLNYSAAFPGCSSEAEPSAATVKYLIDKVKNENIPAVFTIEFSNEAIANAVKEETGCKILSFHSCHNVTKDDFKNGVTYIDLMNRNLKNLKEALN